MSEKYTYNGIVICDYCREHNLEYKLVKARLKRLHWNFEDAVSLPKNNKYPATTKYYVTYKNEYIPLKTAMRKFFDDIDVIRTVSTTWLLQKSKKLNIDLQSAFEDYMETYLKKHNRSL